MSLLQLFAGGANRKVRGVEQLEAEVKILDITEDKIRDALLACGGEKVFEGNVVTTWFKKSPLGRINTRLRVVTTSSGARTFYWSIKTTPSDDTPTSLLKNKLKFQEKAPSLNAAKKALANELKRRGVVTTPAFLTSKLTVEKTRTSYTCNSGECAGLRLDFDIIIAVDGEPLENPLPLLEIEDISDKKANEKETKILACAKKLGLTIDKQFSSLSTRKLLKKLGLRK